MASEQFSLCWDNFHKNMSSGMNALLEHEDLVDVTLAIEGRLLKAHKMVLSVCSPYFKELFKSNPCQHPIVFMKDVSYVAMSDLLQFMYQGEVQVSQDNLTTFIKTAEALQIKGLTGDGNGSTDADTETVPEKPAPRHVEESYKPMPRPKKQPLTPATTSSPTPSTKRPRLSSNDSQSTLTPITKTEPALTSSTNADSSAVQFKVEPYDQNQSALTDDDGGENMDDMLDDSTVDGAEDYSMMEGEEPQAGTSTDGTGEGQDVAGATTLPERSRRHYEAVYNTFMDWRSLQNTDSFSEELLLNYFKQLHKTYSPASLWAYYSMLRSTLVINQQVHIESYVELRNFLKASSKGYKAKKAKLFTQKDVKRFINDAPDKVHLANKVALILASSGACRPAELRALSLEDIVDFGSALLVTIPSSKSRNPRQFTVAGQEYDYIRRYMELRPLNAQSSALFLNYQSGRCTAQNIGVNKFGMMVKQIAEFLQLPNPEQYSGYSFRKSSSWMQKR